MSFHVARRGIVSGAMRVAILTGASNTAGRDGLPADLPTSYGVNERNLQNAQADIVFAAYKDSGIWDVDVFDTDGLTTLQPCGGEISSVAAPRHSREITMGADLADLGLDVGILVYGRGGKGITDFFGTVGTQARAWVADRLAEIVGDYVVDFIDQEAGTVGTDAQEDADAIATRLAAIETAWRAMGFPGASTFVFGVHDTHPTSTAPFLETVEEQFDTFVAGDTARRIIIPHTSVKVIGGDTVTVGDLVGQHWDSASLQTKGRINAVKAFNYGFYPPIE